LVVIELLKLFQPERLGGTYDSGLLHYIGYIWGLGKSPCFEYIQYLEEADDNVRVFIVSQYLCFSKAGFFLGLSVRFKDSQSLVEIFDFVFHYQIRQ